MSLKLLASGVKQPQPDKLNKRRRFFKSLSLIAGSAWCTQNTFAQTGSEPAGIHMPDESHPHIRTWMAFVANEYIWSARQIPSVKRDLALIANTVSKYEPVAVLVNPEDRQEAEELLSLESSPFQLELIETGIDDLWLRDTGPTFVKTPAGDSVAIDFNFNGWGNKQEHARDKKIAAFIAAKTGTSLKQAGLVLEGGCFEVDGNGNAIMTRSCIVNDNRNPQLTELEIETLLSELLGLRKIIWLDGVKGKDITDGHTDFYARFAGPGEVIVSRDNYRASFDYQVTRENIEILAKSTDADGNLLNLSILDTPSIINDEFGTRDFAAGYVGYYVCNGAVIAQKFGDRKADDKAKELLQGHFPDRVVEQIAIDGIASGGGSIHCATQQQI